MRQVVVLSCLGLAGLVAIALLPAWVSFAGCVVVAAAWCQYLEREGEAGEAVERHAASSATTA